MKIFYLYIVLSMLSSCRKHQQLDQISPGKYEVMSFRVADTTSHQREIVNSLPVFIFMKGAKVKIINSPYLDSVFRYNFSHDFLELKSDNEEIKIPCTIENGLYKLKIDRNQIESVGIIKKKKQESK